MTNEITLPKYIKSVSSPDNNGNVYPEWLVRGRDPVEKDPITRQDIIPTQDELNRYYTTLASPSVPFKSQFHGTHACWKRFEDIIHFKENKNDHL